MMGFLAKLKKLIPKPPSNPNDLTIHVQCSRCGENIPARINLRNDLSIEFEEDGQGRHYFCRKVVMGSGMCFQRIELELMFSTDHSLTDQKITGGTIISREEFESGTS
jgi:hypothetical protein